MTHCHMTHEKPWFFHVNMSGHMMMSHRSIFRMMTHHSIFRTKNILCNKYVTEVKEYKRVNVCLCL